MRRTMRSMYARLGHATSGAAYALAASNSLIAVAMSALMEERLARHGPRISPRARRGMEEIATLLKGEPATEQMHEAARKLLYEVVATIQIDERPGGTGQ